MWGPSSSRPVKLVSKNTRLCVAFCPRRKREGSCSGVQGGRELGASALRCPPTPAPLRLRVHAARAPRFPWHRSPRALPPLRLDLPSAGISGAALRRGPPRGPPARPANARWLPERPEPDPPTGPCLSRSSLSCGTWRPQDAPARGAPAWSAPTRCASRPAPRATRPDSRSWAAATASSRRGPPRTRGATSAVTSSGASCARACSARVSSGPKCWRERNGGPRAALLLRVKLRRSGGRGADALRTGPSPAPSTSRKSVGSCFRSAQRTAPASGHSWAG